MKAIFRAHKNPGRVECPWAQLRSANQYNCVLSSLLQDLQRCDIKSPFLLQTIPPFVFFTAENAEFAEKRFEY